MSTYLEVNFNAASMGLAAVGSFTGNVARVAPADEIASAIVFLASDAASNITRAILLVDNGWLSV